MSEEQRLNDFINKIRMNKEGYLDIGLVVLKRFIVEYGKRQYEAGVRAGKESK